MLRHLFTHERTIKKCINAVRMDEKELEFVPNTNDTPEWQTMWLDFIKEYPTAINFVKNPTIEQLVAYSNKWNDGKRVYHYSGKLYYSY